VHMYIWHGYDMSTDRCDMHLHGSMYVRVYMDLNIRNSLRILTTLMILASLNTRRETGVLPGRWPHSMRRLVHGGCRLLQLFSFLFPWVGIWILRQLIATIVFKPSASALAILWLFLHVIYLPYFLPSIEDARVQTDKLLCACNSH
jgi:hypothetical protein